MSADRAMKWRFSTETAATIAGAAMYLPFGIRGALFALCPALVGGRRGLVGRCLILGLLLDAVISYVSYGFGPVWEPRGEFNQALAWRLPPVHYVMTHAGSPVPNSVQFVGGLAGWSLCFFALWMYLWPRPLPVSAKVTMSIVGAVLVASAGAALWPLAPMDERRFPPLSPEPVPHALFALAFCLAMPLATCVWGLIVGRLERRYAIFLAHASDTSRIAEEPQRQLTNRPD